MSRKFTPIKDVNDSKETWRLAVRVVDLWSVINSKGNEHMEMVIMDALGDRIQVLIRSDHTPKWKERIRENMSCIINNGTVYDNDFQWKLCDHDKKFVFIGGTTVKEVDIQNLPPKRFFFKDFTDILGGNNIIGVVQEINNFQYNNSGKKSFVSLSLKDLKGVIVNCTLWESYGTNFLDFYHDEKNSGAIVIVLTHVMIKESQGVYQQNPIIKLLPANEQTEKPSQSSKGVSLWSGASQFTPVESFVHKAKCISLSDLCKVKQDMLCVTVGTTQKFFVSKHGWFYYGCTKCSLKASDVKNPYKCSCGQNVEHAIPRAKVQPTFGQASVWKLSYDEEFVKEIEKDYITNEGDSKPLTQNLVVDRVDDSIESLSAYGENDPDKVVTNTPSKGSPVTLDAGDSECQPYGTTKLSGTKPSKKVKIESNV
ncbi:uncharacterized protein LOC131650644 [Vicia villosa]|uniref:uncharacterized protein LOC131650644 n=1 Tax=Vicia villosa TaxID=3911 RepID=UPI00273B1202|nr:uncharacterized protein LOC131650644 [Vicia villosa]